MRIGAALLALAVTAASAATAQAAPRFEPVDGSYEQPIYLTAPPRDPTRIFVVEREGRVEVVESGVAVSQPFLDLTGALTLTGERGLLSLAFPPDYESSGLAYTYSTGAGGELQVREHRRSAADPNRTEAGSRVVWRQAHPAGNHNGGTIQFGPDGLLWIATGDGGGTGGDVPNNAQRMDTQLGKLLRIDPRRGTAGEYTVPADNPFLAPDDGAVDTIWASGLRNPFRFSFDRGTGDLALGDVGEASREEIDHVRWAAGLGKAGDFGWRCYEGALQLTGCEPRGPYIPPVFDYPRTDGRTVTGGVVVRDPGLPTLQGRYVYADFQRSDIRSLALDAPGADPQSTGLDGAPATHVAAFGEDACGHVYVVSLDGAVSRLADTDAPGCVLTPDPQPLPTVPAPLASGPPPPAAGTATSAPDSRRPSLRVRVTGRRSLVTRRRLRIALRSDEAAAVTVTGRLRGVARFRTARLRLAAGRRTVVNLRISRRTARKLRRTLRRKRVVTRLSIRARDAAGNQRLATRRIVVRRR